jgi:hypothetical protein
MALYLAQRSAVSEFLGGIVAIAFPGKSAEYRAVFDVP